MLRELLRTLGPTCSPLSINRVFANLGMEALLGRVVTRDAPHCNLIAIALSFNLLGEISIHVSELGNRLGRLR